ncbi:serine hydrolase [Streptomyces sp. INA 01156]
MHPLSQVRGGEGTDGRGRGCARHSGRGLRAGAGGVRPELREARDRGAAVAVYRDGHRVVDLWAGTKDINGTAGTMPWQRGTAQIVRSATKGVAAAVPCCCTSTANWTWTHRSATTGRSSRPRARSGCWSGTC